MRRKHGDKLKKTTTVTEQDARIIERSKYTYADAIHYFATKLREGSDIIFREDIEALEDERDSLIIRIAELEAELNRTVKKLEVEIDRSRRRLAKINNELEKYQSLDLDAVDTPDLNHAYRFIMSRVEDWRRRGHDVTPTTRNDEGRDLVDIAAYQFGLPRDEILAKLRREGVDL